MTIDEQIAKLDKWRWLRDQSPEDQAMLSHIKKTLKFAQRLEQKQVPLEVELISKAYMQYGKVVKKHPAYQRFIDTYYEFMREMDVEPVMNAAQGKAMQDIITYLTQQSKSGGEQGALDGWMYILKHWRKLTPFIQNQSKLTQINKNLQEIVMQLRNGNTKTQQKQSSAASAARRVAERRKKRK